MTVQANIVMQPGDHYSHIDVSGHLSVLGSVSNGNIEITSGTLEFQQMAFTHGPELESEKFTSTLSFNSTVGTPASGAVQFDGAIGPLIIGITPQLNEIAVFNLGEKIADFHLGAPTYPYSAADFSVHGNELLYHHS